MDTQIHRHFSSPTFQHLTRIATSQLPSIHPSTSLPTYLPTKLPSIYLSIHPSSQLVNYFASIFLLSKCNLTVIVNDNLSLTITVCKSIHIHWTFVNVLALLFHNFSKYQPLCSIFIFPHSLSLSLFLILPLFPFSILKHHHSKNQSIIAYILSNRLSVCFSNC